MENIMSFHSQHYIPITFTEMSFVFLSPFPVARQTERRKEGGRRREERKGDESRQQERQFLPLLTFYAVLHYSESYFCHLTIYAIITLYQCTEVFLISFLSCVV